MIRLLLSPGPFRFRSAGLLLLGIAAGTIVTRASGFTELEAQRQDLASLRRIPDLDRSFSPAERDAFRTGVDRLLASPQAATAAEFELHVAGLVALADNAHSNARGIAWGRNLNSLPLRFGWFAEGLFVVKAHPSLADLLGAKVIAIGGRSPEWLTRALRPYVGGPENFARELIPNLLQSPAALNAAGLLASPQTAVLTFELLQDDRRIERSLSADAAPAVPQNRNDWPKRSLSPVPIPGDKRKWAHLLDKMRQLPLDLGRPEDPYWHAWLGGSDALYLQINVMRTRGAMPLDTYLDKLLRECELRQPRTAVIDLRFNAGGDYQLTNRFAERLAGTMPAGRVFIVTSANTFSAAIVLAARLKYFSGGRAVIVGERIGDRERFWAEGSTLVLSHSQIPVRYADGYHDWCAGAQHLNDLAPSNVPFAVSAGDLSPRIPVPLRFADYLAGRDAALETILRRAADLAREPLSG